MRLKEARKLEGHTQTTLAKAAGVGFRTVQDWEYGRMAPGGDNLLALAKALNKPTDYFFEEGSESYRFVAGPRAAEVLMRPQEPVLTSKAPLPPSKTKHIRQSQALLRKALEAFAAEQAEGKDRESALRTMAKAQRDIIAALDELDKLRD